MAKGPRAILLLVAVAGCAVACGGAAGPSAEGAPAPVRYEWLSDPVEVRTGSTAVMQLYAKRVTPDGRTVVVVDRASDDLPAVDGAAIAIRAALPDAYLPTPNFRFRLIDRRSRRAWDFEWGEVDPPASTLDGELRAALERIPVDGYRASMPPDGEGAFVIGEQQGARDVASLRHRDDRFERIRFDARVHDPSLTVADVCAILLTLDAGPASGFGWSSSLSQIVLLENDADACRLEREPDDRTWTVVR